MTSCRYIDQYINLVRSGKFEVCEYQLLLCEFVEKIFKAENLFINEKQLEKYMSFQKYFPFKLFEWEEFCFALHNCVYCEDGTLRFPDLVIYIGRGNGKNGFLGFEDFCLLTEVNGVMHYDIDIFAMSEQQAKTSWSDVYDVLENNKAKMSKHFHWTKEKITNIKTKSEYRYNTSSPKTKDGSRPGKINFDEYHAYESYKLIDVAKTGTGKVAHYRSTIITTDGLIRGGALDDLIVKCIKILKGEVDDNGTLPFLCCLDNDDEVHNEKMWYKANPSLQYLPYLLKKMRAEYADYILNPAANISFITKRMNRPPRELENCVTSWENILATQQKIEENIIYAQPCVGGIDYAKTNDWVGAGLLYRVNNKDYWISHAWVCKQSASLKSIKAPIAEWERQGLLTIIDAPEISPDIVAIWLKQEAEKRKSSILKIGIDSYRYTLMSKALKEINFSAEKDYKNIVLLRPSNEMLRIPLITSDFINHRYVWGDNRMMCWAANNSKIVTSPQGNMTYGKIEPYARKTDPFKAFVAAECVSDCLDDCGYNTGFTLSMKPICY